MPTSAPTSSSTASSARFGDAGTGHVVRAPRERGHVVRPRDGGASRRVLELEDAEVPVAGAREPPRGREARDARRPRSPCRRAPCGRRGGTGDRPRGGDARARRRGRRSSRRTAGRGRLLAEHAREGGREGRERGQADERRDRVAAAQSKRFHSPSYVLTRTWSLSRFTGDVVDARHVGAEDEERREKLRRERAQVLPEDASRRSPASPTRGRSPSRRTTARRRGRGASKSRRPEASRPRSRSCGARRAGTWTARRRRPRDRAFSSASA